jgi:serine phosphatase RsbU (regulator of sigma subunit)
MASIALLTVFFVATLSIRNAIAVNASNLDLVQRARLGRARLLRVQLDEETGIRGYAATHGHVFLEPFIAGREGFDAAAASLDEDLRRLSLDRAPLDDERAINRMWIARIAKPILHSPLGRHVKVELLGKSLIDRFRSDDDALAATMQQKELAFQRDTGALIDRMLISALAIGVALAVVLGGLALYQARLASESEQRRLAYERERQAALALQEAILRIQLPKLPAIAFDAVYAPASAEAVGGDWYDAMELDSQHVLFSIGDAAGHDLRAAVVMSRARQSIASIAMADRDPAVILNCSNRVLLRRGAGLVTAICGVVDAQKKTFAYAGAGHPPMILRHRDGRTERLAAPGPPLGVANDAPYRSDSKAIEPGSMLVLYTDGVIEQERNFQRGEERLLEAVRSVGARSKDPAAEILSLMLGNVPATDDVAILTLRFREHAFVDG